MDSALLLSRREMQEQLAGFNAQAARTPLLLSRREMQEQLATFNAQAARIGLQIAAVSSRVSVLENAAQSSLSDIRSLESLLTRHNSTTAETGLLLAKAVEKQRILEPLLAQQKVNLTMLEETRKNEVEPLAAKKTVFQDFQIQVGDAQQSVDAIRPVMERTRELVDELDHTAGNFTVLLRESVNKNLEGHLMDTNHYHREALKVSTRETSVVKKNLGKGVAAVVLAEDEQQGVLSEVA